MEHTTAPRRARGSTARRRAVAYALHLAPLVRELAAVHVTNDAIAWELNRLAIPSETGAPWTLQAVGGLRRRLEVIEGRAPALHHRPAPRRFRRKLPAPRPGAGATAVHTETAYGTPNG